MHSEIKGQTQQDSTHAKSLKESDSQTESRWWGPWAGGAGRRLVFNGDRISVQDDEKVLEMDGGDGCTPVRIIHIKWLK